MLIDIWARNGVLHYIFFGGVGIPVETPVYRYTFSNQLHPAFRTHLPSFSEAEVLKWLREKADMMWKVR